jgi:hypothetical protein
MRSKFSYMVDVRRLRGWSCRRDGGLGLSMIGFTVAHGNVCASGVVADPERLGDLDLCIPEPASDSIRG